MDFLLGSDIHSPRGFIKKEESGLTVDPLSRTVLLIAPERDCAGLVWPFDPHALVKTGPPPFGLGRGQELGKALSDGRVKFLHGLSGISLGAGDPLNSAMPRSTAS